MTTFKMTHNIGKAIGILIEAALHEEALHDDVDAFHAPSECHDLVARGEGKRFRLARRRALHASGFNSMRLLRREVHRRLGNDAPIYRRYGFVPYWRPTPTTNAIVRIMATMT